MTPAPAARRVGVGLLALAGLALLNVVPRSAASDPLPGSAGIDTSLPATDSQVTMNGRGPYAGLAVTVNQTRSLSNQAVSITWTGGTPTKSGPGRFAANYLQVMQCWGDDDGAIPANPGPPPEQCVQGATDAVFGGRNVGIFPGGGFTLERIISRSDWQNFDAADGYLDDRTGLLWKPFRAVDGTVVNTHYDPTFRPAVVGGSYWLNPFFNATTTNEISGGRTGPNGTGSELFEVTTGVESSGLGCGQKVVPNASGSPTIPKCWLVIVPRGDAVTEDAGTPFAESADEVGVYTSPLSPAAWKHRLAIPLEFNPVDSSCALNDEQRRLVGTELVVPAVASWQPELCANPDLSPYAYGIVSDAAARQQLLGRAPGGPGMVIVSRPYDVTALDPTNPVTYAPISISGLVIGFNVERVPSLEAPPEELLLQGVRVADLNLTPRLVAKLLTQSYRSQIEIKTPPPYEWDDKNPAHLGLDPDFLQFNPEFKILQAGGRNFGGLVMAARNSDAAQQLWEWLLADPEARAWLDGSPDPWGMKVNPVYATTPAANSSGVAFGDPVPDEFPKSDPYCYQAPNQGTGGTIVPPPLCGTDWLPYSPSLRDAARAARIANDGARTSEDPLALSSDKVYRADGPQTLGRRVILSLTDSPSASLYGLQVARLSRSGDNGPDRRFIAPDRAGLLAGADAMVAKDEPSVLEPDPTVDAPAAYPLTALAYAAITPLALDEVAREEYAAFVDYAAGPGQVAGLELGQLPSGYAPLSAALRTQATNASTTIRELQPVAEESTEAITVETPTVEPPPIVEAALSPPAAAATASRRVTARPAPGEVVVTPPAPAPSVEPPTKSSPPSIVATPIVSLARNRFALPILVGIALLSALGALEITKRPRRRLEAS